MAKLSRKRHHNKFQVPDLLKSISEQMSIALKQNLIPHPGELGTGREEIMRDFLRKHLPQKFGVTTGFVFDAQGNISKQVDVIIFDNSNNPTFEAAGGKQFIPCESVVCVGEIKSSLTSKQEILKAFENIRSVKVLDRSGNGENFALGLGTPINTKEDHLDQIFSFLFVIDKCVSEETMRKTLFEYMWENERHLWVNLCFYYENYLLTYCCENGICPNPMDAFAISSIPNATSGYLLLTFYRLLARAINVIRVSSFSYWEYLNGREGFIDTYAYPFKDAPVTSKLPDHLLNRSVKFKPS